MGQKTKPVQKFAQGPRNKKRLLTSLRRQVEETGKYWIDIVKENNPDALLADGFDSCILGVCARFGWPSLIAYDYEKCIALLMRRDGMSYSDAIDFFEVNVMGAWVGEGTPVFVSTVME